MLRRQLGDTTFKKIIRKYYETYAGKNADTRDFQQIAEMVSGKKLDKFITQWLYTPENPKLSINWKYEDKTKEVLLTITQLQGQLFELPLEIEISNKIEKINISRQSETFTILVAAKPRSINPDPSVSLLFEATVTAEK
jgi:aminopeptidase N